jgi:hypothetical protein
MSNKKLPAQIGLSQSEPTTQPERSAVVTIDGAPYALLLTTRATREITRRFGGIEALGEHLLTDDLAAALTDILWLIVLLANQPISIHNLRHPESPKPYLTEEEVELLTQPYEIADYREALVECIVRGTKRDVESEPEPGSGDTKNPQAE